MALVISRRSPSSCEAACYHGQEQFVRSDNSMLSPTHWVDVAPSASLASLGWTKRAGRLPICPEHREPGDLHHP